MRTVQCTDGDSR